MHSPFCGNVLKLNSFERTSNIYLYTREVICREQMAFNQWYLTGKVQYSPVGDMKRPLPLVPPSTWKCWRKWIRCTFMTPPGCAGWRETWQSAWHGEQRAKEADDEEMKLVDKCQMECQQSELLLQTNELLNGDEAFQLLQTSDL